MSKHVRMIVPDKTHAKAHYIAQLVDASASDIYPAALECLINFHGLDDTVEYIRDFLSGDGKEQPVIENGNNDEDE